MEESPKKNDALHQTEHNSFIYKQRICSLLSIHLWRGHWWKPVASPRKPVASPRELLIAPHLSASPVLFSRFSNPTSALPSKKSAISSGFFCRKYIYIVKKRDIPHIPHISHVKMLQQAASTEVLKLFYVRDVRDVRDVFFVCLIYARARKGGQNGEGKKARPQDCCRA